MICEKGFYKLLNNAFYGKTIENDRNRLKTKFVNKDDNREKKTTIQTNV